MSDLYVSWSEYHKKIEILATHIYQSGWNFNQIVCIAKGGLRVGDLLSRLYNIPLAIFVASSYGGPDNRERGKIRFSQHITSANNFLGDRVLLVDDLVDSGISLLEGKEWLNNYDQANEIKEMRTAVIWWKAQSMIKPDYYVDYLVDNPWIHQPFEYYEQITPQQLHESYQDDTKK